MPFRSARLAAVSLYFGAAAASALAAPLDDPNHTITIQLENDSTRPGSDNYYTSGERVAYTSPTGAVADSIAGLASQLFGTGTQRFGVELSQQIFTPLRTKATNPPLNDRPYAGVLLGTVSLIHDTDSARTVLGLSLGVIGPAAQGREVQNGFHDLIGQGGTSGWNTQIPNQPIVQLTAGRAWRIPLGAIGGLETDVLPAATLGAGSYRIYALGGGTIRIGQGLASDFGAPRIAPGLTGTDAYTPTQPFAWYVFAGADGQAVAWDETLDGLPFATSRHVSRQPLVGEFQAGVSVMAFGARLTASHTLRSNEFRGQGNGVFQFSSASISFKF